VVFEKQVKESNILVKLQINLILVLAPLLVKIDPWFMIRRMAHTLGTEGSLLQVDL
jgi:hypothetical protein